MKNIFKVFTLMSILVVTTQLYAMEYKYGNAENDKTVAEFKSYSDHIVKELTCQYKDSANEGFTFKKLRNLKIKKMALIIDPHGTCDMMILNDRVYWKTDQVSLGNGWNESHFPDNDIIEVIAWKDELRQDNLVIDLKEVNIRDISKVDNTTRINHYICKEDR